MRSSPERRLPVSIVLSLGPWMLVACAASPGSRTGPATQLSSQAEVTVGGPDARVPNLLYEPVNGLHLTWIEPTGDGSRHVLRHATQRGGFADVTDVAEGDDLLVNWADFPTLAAAPDGTLLLAWLVVRRPLPGYGIDFALSRDGGATWSSPQPLHDDVHGGEHGFVSLVAEDATTFRAIWLDGREAAGHGHGNGHGGDETSGAFQLRSRVVWFDGTLGPEIVIDDDVCSCCQTDLVPLEDGSLVAVYRDRSPENVRDVSWVRYDGALWSAPATLAEDGWEIPGCPVNGPRSAGEAVVWYTGVGPAGGEVFVTEFAAPEGALGARLDVDDGHPLGRVDVLTLEPDVRAVTWLENVGDGEAEWRVRIVHADGTSYPSRSLGVVPSTRAVGFLRGQRTDDGASFTWSVPGDGVRVLHARAVD